jgi:hypothetical protein
MDTQPERFKDFGKRVEVFWDGDSVFYRGTVTAYSAATRKHTILYDDNDVERVCLEVSAPALVQGLQKGSKSVACGLRAHAMLMRWSCLLRRHQLHG